MADAYIDSGYLDDHLGSDFVAAATVTGVDLTKKIEAATSLIQSAMRNSGYSPISTTDPTAVEEVVKLAVLGAVAWMLHTTPEVAVDLPEGWDSHPANVAYAGILNGDVKLAAEPSDAGAVGGMSFSDSTSGANTVRSTYATRTNLKGY